MARTFEIPDQLRAPPHIPRGSSQRLDAAVDAVAALLDAGRRIVAIDGAPGDGKTQVARRIADTRNGYYIELDVHASAEAALKEGLSGVVEAFGDPPCVDRSLKTICAKVRNKLYQQSDDPLLVIDALDAPCSLAQLESLLGGSHRGALVVAGPGAFGVPKVHLDAADPETFAQAFERRWIRRRTRCPRTDAHPCGRSGCISRTAPSAPPTSPRSCAGPGT